MSPRAHAVPRSVGEIPDWVTNFTQDHGLAPFAGGETMVGVPPAAAPQAQPAPAPAPAVAPAPAPAPVAPQVAAPAQPQPWGQPLPQVAAPAAPVPGQPQVAPGQPGVEPAEQIPEWAKAFVAPMANVQQPPADPFAVELGLVDPPMAAPQAQPGVLTPQAPAPGSQQPPAAGGPQQPQVAPLPGVDPRGQAIVEDWVGGMVEDRAAALAQEQVEALKAEIMPELQTFRRTQRQGEMQGLLQDFPELQTREVAMAALSRARNAAQGIFGTQEAAQNPAFIEVIYRAGKQMEAEQAARAQQPAIPTPQPAVPGGAVPVPLEQPGGSPPGPPADPGQQLVAAIKAAGNGSNLAPIWS